MINDQMDRDVSAGTDMVQSLRSRSCYQTNTPMGGDPRATRHESGMGRELDCPRSEFVHNLPGITLGGTIRSRAGFGRPTRI